MSPCQENLLSEPTKTFVSLDLTLTYLTEVLLHELVRSLVDQLVVVALQQLDAVQAAQLLHQ